jgi:hypothetical protein
MSQKPKSEQPMFPVKVPFGEGQCPMSVLECTMDSDQQRSALMELHKLVNVQGAEFTELDRIVALFADDLLLDHHVPMDYLCDCLANALPHPKAATFITMIQSGMLGFLRVSTAANILRRCSAAPPEEVSGLLD